MNSEDAGYLYWRHDAPEAAFEETGPSTAADDYASLMMEQELSRPTIAGHSLDGTFVTERGSEISLRWVCVPMIEEYAAITATPACCVSSWTAPPASDQPTAARSEPASTEYDRSTPASRRCRVRRGARPDGT